MTAGIISKALFNSRNLGIAALTLILFIFFKWEPLLIIGILALLSSSLQLLFSVKFKERCLIEDKIQKIRTLNYKTAGLYNHLRSRVAKKFTTKVIEKIYSIIGKANYVDFETRITNIFNIKTEIVSEFFNKEYSPIREKITLKSLELAVVYFKLMDTYVSRVNDVSNNNFSYIEERLRKNKQKKSSAGNSSYKNDLERAIEADEKLLERLVESRKEVEKMSAKLNVIESTILLLKQQIFADHQSEEILENIENTVNEAEALESALDQHFKTRKRNKA